MKFTQYLFYSKTRTKLVAFRLGWFGFDKGKRKKKYGIMTSSFFPYFSSFGHKKLTNFQLRLLSRV